jgi:dTMP kinase
MQNEKTGKLIVIEGTDGTGKATQTELLINKLREQGHEVAHFDFPQYGKNVFARAVASYLRGEFGTATEINPYLASFAYAGDRSLMKNKIKKQLEKGSIVVLNRYTTANMGHQGGKIKDKEERKKFIAWLKELEYGEEGYNIPKPELVLLLYLDPGIAQGLVDKKARREYTEGEKRDGHEDDINHLRDAAKTFLEVAEEEPDWKVINCNNQAKDGILSRKQIHEKIWDVVNDNITSQI